MVKRSSEDLLTNVNRLADVRLTIVIFIILCFSVAFPILLINFVPLTIKC